MTIVVIKMIRSTSWLKNDCDCILYRKGCGLVIVLSDCYLGKSHTRDLFRENQLGKSPWKSIGVGEAGWGGFSCLVMETVC